MPFTSEFGRTIYRQKYSHGGRYTWEELADLIVEEASSPAKLRGLKKQRPAKLAGLAYFRTG